MVSNTSKAVDIKGTRDGLVVTLGQGSFVHLLPLLADALAARRGFLDGSHIALDVGQRELTAAQLTAVQDVFAAHGLTLWTVLAESEQTRSAARDLGLATRLAGSQTDLEGNALAHTAVSTTTPSATATKPQSTHHHTTNAIFIRETLRSGRSVYHEGPVVVFGDVNPGAEILAAGDVVVWGRLRGMVHAGALGDATAVICALELTPTQLRIADQIAIAPDDRGRQSQPEQAVIRNGRIVAESWQQK